MMQEEGLEGLAAGRSKSRHKEAFAAKKRVCACDAEQASSR